MFTAGTPADNPAAAAVLVTSAVVTVPRRYRVKIMVASEINLWVTVVHHRGGTAVSSVFVPVTGAMVGPVEIYETYFAAGDYVDIAVRDGSPAVVGTVQASVELV